MDSTYHIKYDVPLALDGVYDMIKFVKLEKVEGRNDMMEITNISEEPKEGFEEIKTLRVTFQRNWSVGYGELEEARLTAQYRLVGQYYEGKSSIKGTRNDLGANSEYYIQDAYINNKLVMSHWGMSKFRLDQILENYQIDAR